MTRHSLIAVFALFGVLAACAPVGYAPPTSAQPASGQIATRPAGAVPYNPYGPQTDTPRYDYPGPALTGGCVC